MTTTTHIVIAIHSRQMVEVNQKSYNKIFRDILWMQVIGIAHYDAELELIKLQYVAVTKTTIEFKKEFE